MSDPLDRIRRTPSPRLVRQLAAAGIVPGELRFEDLARLGAVRPADLDLAKLDDPVGDALLADAPRPARLGACERDGATIVLPFTAADLARIASYGARALAAAGVSRGSRVANTLDGGFETPGSLVLGDALERLGALDVPLGPVRDAKTAHAIAAMIDRVGAEVLVLDPPSAPALLEALAEIRPASWRGTVWLGRDDKPAGMRGWCRRWISLPEVSVFFAVESADGSLRLDPDVHVERRDGTVRVSTIAGDAPLIAYEPGFEHRDLTAPPPRA